MTIGVSRREINVYGIGITAMKFVLSNNDLSIKNFIEGRHVKQKFMGLDIPIVDYNEAENILKKYYTIVACQEHIYHEIKDKLELYGLREFVDFEYYECFKKKVAIVYGNCHGGVVKSYLRMSKEFSAEYGLYPVKPIQECAGYKKEHPDWDVIVEYKAALEACSLFIHQGVKKENYFGEEYSSDNFIKHLKPECRKIIFPNLYRMPMFMFPQMPSYTDNVRWEGIDWFYKDIFIDANYKDMTLKQLVLMIEKENLIPVKDTVEGKEIFEEKVREKKKHWDIKILNHIKSGYGKAKLFYDSGHPTGYIMKYIANNLLRMLGFSSVDYLLQENTAAELDIYEIPLYRSVRKALSLPGGTSI